MPLLRRSYSLQLKLEVVGQCQQPCALIAAIALSDGINANIVHRWLREHARGELAVGAVKPASSESFVPVRLEPSAMGLSPGAAEPDIRVEIRTRVLSVLNEASGAVTPGAAEP